MCHPSPCGPYSQCKEINDRAICSCLENYIGSPPACRPECTINSDCLPDKACINLKCVDACASCPCGDQALCHAINHNPICSCPLGYTGDPFIRCTPEESKLSGTFTHLHLVFVGYAFFKIALLEIRIHSLIFFYCFIFFFIPFFYCCFQVMNTYLLQNYTVF